VRSNDIEFSGEKEGAPATDDEDAGIRVPAGAPPGSATIATGAIKTFPVQVVREGLFPGWDDFLFVDVVSP